MEHVETRERIIDAARKGGAEEVDNELRLGYDTVLGGEWQNVAIACAFMSESQSIFLDQPTSALNALGEPALHARFARLTENKTVIFISHRFDDTHGGYDRCPRRRENHRTERSRNTDEPRRQVQIDVQHSSCTLRIGELVAPECRRGV